MIKFFIWYIGAKPRKIKDVVYLIRLLYRQSVTELWCKRRHKQWIQIQPPLHGAGKYVYNGYKCNVCGRVHITYELNCA